MLNCRPRKSQTLSPYFTHDDNQHLAPHYPTRTILACRFQPSCSESYYVGSIHLYRICHNRRRRPRHPLRTAKEPIHSSSTHPRDNSSVNHPSYSAHICCPNGGAACVCKFRMLSRAADAILLCSMSLKLNDVPLK